MSAQIVRRYYSSYDDDYNQNVGLAIGAWVGIVIGIIIFKVLIITAICYLCKRNDRKRRQARMTNPLYRTPGYAPQPYIQQPQGHGPVQYTGYYGASGKAQPDASYTMPAVPDATYISTAQPAEIASHHHAHGHHGGHDTSTGTTAANNTLSMNTSGGGTTSI